MSDNTKVISRNRLKQMIASLPRNSHIRQYPPQLQSEVIIDILKDEPASVILRRLQERGVKGITYQQLARLKRHIKPMWIESNTPNTFFDGQLADQLERFKFLLDEQYARIVESLEDELLIKEHLMPNKYSKVNPGDDYKTLRQLIVDYHNGNICSDDKNYLLSVMDKRGQDGTIDKRLTEFWKILKQYIELRKGLGDKGMVLDAAPQEPDKFNPEEIDGFDAKELGRSLRKQVIAAAKGTDDNDGKKKT